MASTFSTEHLSHSPTFGFHGIPLLAKFFSEGFLISLIDEIFLRASLEDFLAALLRNAIQLGKLDLAREIIAKMLREHSKYERTLRLFRVIT